MDMEVTAWMSLYKTMHAQQDRRPFSKATLKRIGAFARPHRRELAWFLLLSVVTALLAIVEAGLGLVNRWLSASIGEGLILDLRTAVFDHVQRMPIAFFTRTRTGALVSRLNSDVIGAQRAFSDTLSGVVVNLVTLTLTLAVMLSISWQITLLSLVLVPLFIVPARRIGAAMARLSREAAIHN